MVSLTFSIRVDLLTNFQGALVWGKRFRPRQQVKVGANSITLQPNAFNTGNSVARMPLYVVGLSDVGTQAERLESQLTKIFTIAATWRAVVLIDEADVFLERRSLASLERNAMVATFIRQIE
jgi:hypothetical protein